MARALFTALGILAGVAVTMPAAAQFGDLFRESPPRPPGDISGERSRSLPPPDPNVTPQGRLPPGPPPGRSSIQRQELPPPPGVARQPGQRSPWISPDLRPPESPPGGQDAARQNVNPQDPTGGQQPGIPAFPPSGQQQQQGQQAALPPADNEVIIKPPEEKVINPIAVFSGLDKVTGRITEFEVKINETVRFGALEVTPRACYTRPPTETQITDGFIEVDELTLQGELKRIFTGWMFVASPGLNAVEHPIYDVWLKDCKGENEERPEVARREGGGEASGAATPVPLPRPADL